MPNLLESHKGKSETQVTGIPRAREVFDRLKHVATITNIKDRGTALLGGALIVATVLQPSMPGSPPINSMGLDLNLLFMIFGTGGGVALLKFLKSRGEDQSDIQSIQSNDDTRTVDTGGSVVIVHKNSGNTWPGDNGT